jgi:hydroxyacylglutathione hydrolase
MQIHRISLPLSNAFLICGRKNILVDAGCQTDFSQLSQQLSARAVKVETLAAVVLTHIHFDHCGCAAELRKRGVPVVACAQAEHLLRSGRQEGSALRAFAPKFLRSTLGSLVPQAFPAVEVDVPVSGSIDLADFGVDGRIELTPGHTETSLSVVLANGSACVGDLLMGGVLGLPPAWKPAQHPATLDKSSCLREITRLRRLGVRNFHVGHGDLIEASFIDRWLESQ